MNTELINFLRTFIQQYDDAVDKDSFIKMWRDFINADDVPLTLSDAFDAVEGEAWAQVYMNQEG